MSYQFEGIDIPAGTSEWIDIEVTVDADDRLITVPTCVVHGGDGPVIWVQGCLHGSEHVGAVAVRNFVTALDAAQLTGTVIAAPVINRVAFASKERTAPLDHQDLNRSFPGSANGSFTDNLANKVYLRAREHADFFVDLHTGGNEFIIPGYSIYPKTGDSIEEQSHDMCRVSDLPYSIRVSREFLSDAMFFVLAEEGIPSIILEMGGEGRLHDVHMANAERALENIGMHIGLLDGDPTPQNDMSLHESMTILQAQAGGIFEATVEGNERVREGQQIAKITDLRGQSREIITMPYDGIIVALRTYAIARPGDWIFELTPE